MTTITHNNITIIITRINGKFFKIDRITARKKITAYAHTKKEIDKKIKLFLQPIDKIREITELEI